MALTSNSADVPSKPCARNTVIAPSSALSVSNSRGLAMSHQSSTIGTIVQEQIDALVPGGAKLPMSLFQIAETVSSTRRNWSDEPGDVTPASSEINLFNRLDLGGNRPVAIFFASSWSRIRQMRATSGAIGFCLGSKVKVRGPLRHKNREPTPNLHFQDRTSPRTVAVGK